MAYQTFKTDVKLGSGQSLGFRSGKGYFARTGGGGGGGGGGGAAPVDPFAPLTPAQIANQIAGYTAKLPAPLTEQQIRARAQGMLDPVVKSITDRANAQTKAAAGASAGYANELAKNLGAYDTSTANIYGTAERNQANADAVEQAALRGGGNDLAAALTSQMNGFGAGPDATKTFGAAPAATGAGAATALLGTGSATLGQLLANEASARDYGAKQPGFARAQGAADVRDITLAGNKTLADNVAQVEQGLPAILENLRNSNDARVANRANAAQHLWELLTGRNIDVAKYKSALDASGLKTQASADASAAKDAKPSASLSRVRGYVVDGNGNAILGSDGKKQILPGYTTDKTGQVVKVTTTKTPKGTDTTKARQSAVTKSESSVTGYFEKNSTVGVTNQATGEKKTVRIKIGSPTYNERIDRAVALVHDALSPYMTDAQIHAYVVAKAKPFFAPPGP